MPLGFGKRDPRIAVCRVRPAAAEIDRVAGSRDRPSAAPSRGRASTIKQSIPASCKRLAAATPIIATSVSLFAIDDVLRRPPCYCNDLINQQLEGAATAAAGRHLEHAGLVAVGVDDGADAEALQ